MTSPPTPLASPPASAPKAGSSASIREQSAKTSISARLPELDGLRGLAALAVVLYHYTTRYTQLYGRPEDLSFSLPIGHYGVQLFFSISGFVILLTLTRTRSGSDFIISRFARLYPAYWAAVLFTFLVVAHFGLPGREVSLTVLIANLTMLHSFVGLRSVDGVYWTLAVELVFYAWMYFAYKTGAIRRIEHVVVAALSAAVLLSPLAKADWLPRVVSVLLLIEHIPYFALGIVFFRLRAHGINQRLVALVVACIGAAGLVGGGDDAAVALAIASIFSMLLAGRLGLLRSSWLTWLGGVTYTVYLVHQNFGYVIIRFLNGMKVDPTLSVLCAIAATLFVAQVLSSCVERPGQQALKLLLASNRGARQSLMSRQSSGATPIKRDTDHHVAVSGQACYQPTVDRFTGDVS